MDAERHPRTAGHLLQGKAQVIEPAPRPLEDIGAVPRYGLEEGCEMVR
jgi:hypothetical protein